MRRFNKHDGRDRFKGFDKVKKSSRKNIPVEVSRFRHQRRLVSRGLRPFAWTAKDGGHGGLGLPLFGHEDALFLTNTYMKLSRSWAREV